MFRPTPVVDYGWCIYPNQLSGEIECWGWGVPYPDNVGGVVSMSPTHWRGINGFSNEYDGWGGEDDDLYLRLKQNSLLKGGCHTWCKDRNKPTVPMVRRPPDS
ncbi:4-N-acetylgalactosaminyltransferase bre-4 (Bacillus thuringiensis toxin-resistant protein 4) (Bt toxin-resistant protein 4) (Beta-4-GalNAcT) [Durusdinium trenchii]|uniref:4-N-acetylgalactosaminyltransferase bre-4 (Bacillus thuringiensis toxin-resistant protein 4) (Bt toxin-resistant protein 4) (Beta-4-GalNAcT) n=1 Tax=Durusdinium trenchii TaxID=1381693 RepID=A0ABP0S9H8_9DINO